MLNSDSYLILSIHKSDFSHRRPAGPVVTVIQFVIAVSFHISSVEIQSYSWYLSLLGTGQWCGFYKCPLDWRFFHNTNMFIQFIIILMWCGCLICQYILQKRTLCCQNHIMCFDIYLIITGKSNIPILFCSSETYHWNVSL